MTPLRRTILQCSQSRLTDARTFMTQNLSLILLDADATLRKVVRRQFHRDFVTHPDADRLRSCPAAHMGQQLMPVRQFDPEQGLFQDFHYRTFNFDGIRSRHVSISGSDSVISTVCSKWADSEPS